VGLKPFSPNFTVIVSLIFSAFHLAWSATQRNCHLWRIFVPTHSVYPTWFSIYRRWIGKGRSSGRSYVHCRSFQHAQVRV